MPHEKAAIKSAIEKHIAHGPYPCDPIYGDGTAGVQIADVLATCGWKLQKLITY